MRKTTPLLVRDLPEEALLAEIFPLLPTAATTLVGPGDDCAVVAAPDGRYVVSTDVLVEDRHFRRRWSTGYDVGWRAAVQNLADIAAMGARPAALVVSLVMPGDLPVEWVTGLARGLAAACTPHGAAVVGGDLSGGDQVVVAVTVHGDLEGRTPVLRSGARPGDVVVLAGTLGRAAAGLDLLALGRPEAHLSDAYLRPDPPLAAGPRAADAGATAMMDVSDGLLRDAGRIARASGVRIEITGAALEPDRAVLREAATVVAASNAGDRTVATNEDARRGAVDDWVLAGGEDHALLATFPAEAVLPEPFRAIGVVERAPASGADVTVDGAGARSVTGWDHFGA